MNKVFYISFCALDRAFHYPVHSKSHLAQRLGDFINHTLTKPLRFGQCHDRFLRAGFQTAV